ncbi:hypothetical protein ASF24_15600 [Methylobacterium sp. Leaf86]|uniref:hypothetical protein n=1 Tax=Methylobacterium sp. Leaf86 TaxID=1736242 RepID=UPI0006F33C87|nr:hypothetical protein [Methylobacterium sp. Leaf86]KQO58064.1 hypothetical protein ASF24_15600 [Methylobacterium sp. Leaf86]
MFSFDTRDPNENLVFDDEDTVAPDAYAHPVAARAAEERATARRNREWRARAKDRAILDAVLVDAMVSAQKHVRDAEKAKVGKDHMLPPPVLLGTVTQLAYRALRDRGWTKDKANEHLAARLLPKRAPLDPLTPKR